MTKINPPIKPRRPLTLARSKKGPRLRTNHDRFPKPSKLRKDPSPDEVQEEVTSEVNPAYVNPDGSVNFWATLNTTHAKENSTDDEPSED